MSIKLAIAGQDVEGNISISDVMSHQNLAQLSPEDPRVLFGDGNVRLIRQPNGYYRKYFPRSNERKLARMDRFVNWKRQKIQEREEIKWARRKKEWIAVGAILLGFPVVITVLAWVWKAAIISVLG